jgi:hypothetical protein
MSTQQRAGSFLLDVGVDGVAEEPEGAAILWAAGGDHGPDALGPTIDPCATGPLGEVPVDHDMSNRLLGLVVRRLDP